MPNIPQLRSRSQIFGDLVDAFLARTKEINDLNRGSVVKQFFDAVSQGQFKAAADIIAMIDALSIDRATGDALQRLARDKNVPILSGTPSSGPVTITDTSFTKVATTVFSGQPAPVAGTSKLYVTDASKFSTTGSLYLGRGTSNVEGPIRYLSAQAEGGGAYWSISLDPTSLTTKFHNIGETVVMARGGNRLINTGSTVTTAQGASTLVSFVTVSPATILDGETVVTAVPVTCTDIGIKGNVPKGAIREATGLSFAASVYNPNAFSNGIPADNDDTLRARIKAYEQAKSKGTEIAIQLASIDVVSPDEQKKVQSSSVVTYADNSAALVFDDGSGYEPLYAGVGLEQVVDEALGGESELQLRKRPVAQVRVKNNLDAPYDIQDADAIDVQIAGVRKIHFFKAADFKVLGSATPFEVINSINGDPNFHCYATTADNSTRVVLFPRDRLANDMQVIKRVTVDANDVLGFSTVKEYTIRLYKNDLPLYEDGIFASVATRIQPLWSGSIGGSETLQYSVDSAPDIIATITTSDFQMVDPTQTLAASTPLAIWATVLNIKLPGLTAVVNGQTLVFYSNLGYNNRAAVAITGGTLLTKMFPVGISLVSIGRASDFTLNKQTGQLGLATSLLPLDSLTAGSAFTRGKLLTASIPNGSPAAGNLWMVVDGAAKNIPNGFRSNTGLSVTAIDAERISVQGMSNINGPATEGFEQVQVGDWFLLWAEATDIAWLQDNSGFWRVEAIVPPTNGTGPALILNVGNSAEFWTTSPPQVIATNRIAITRSSAPMQKLSFPIMGLSTLADFIDVTVSGVGTYIRGDALMIFTKTYGDNGEIYLAAADTGGKALGLIPGTLSDNIPSQLGFAVTKDSEAGVPSFTYSTLAGSIDQTTLVDPVFADIGGTPDSFIQILGSYDLAKMTDLPNNNQGVRLLVEDFDPATGRLTVLPPSYLNDIRGATVSPWHIATIYSLGAIVIYSGQRYVSLSNSNVGNQPDISLGSSWNVYTDLQAGDRYFIRTAYKFDSRDTATMIIDGNPTTETYSVPVARRLETDAVHSIPTVQSFSASDAESSLPLANASSFYNFDFTDFEAWRQANTELTDGTYDIEIKSADFGPSGNRIRVGFVYPQSLTQPDIGYRVSGSDTVDIGLIIPITTARTPNWDGTSSFTTSVVTTGGLDTVTYQWRIGTSPTFGIGGALVAPGDIAIIDSASNLLAGDKGITAKVTAVTATSFSIVLPTGTAVSDNVSFLTASNQGGITTVVTSGPHGITPGDVVGLWNTPSPDGSNYPFDTTYTPTVVNPTTFTIPTPITVPHGNVSNGSHSANLVTITSTAHGLSVGNTITVSGVGVLDYNGTYTVSAVLNANQFQYVVNGSSSAVTAGVWAYQPYAASLISTPITTITRAGNLVTVNSLSHGLIASNVVQIAGVVEDAYVSITSYSIGDVVKYSGTNYVSLANTNAGNQPDISPTFWAVTSQTFNGEWVVQTAGTNSFTFYTGDSGTMSGTGGTAAKVVATGSIARSLGAGAQMLSFAQIGTTAQQMTDWITTNIPSILSAVNLGSPTAPITVSTMDLSLGSNYISGTISAINTIAGSATIRMTSNVSVPVGSRLTITTGSTAYNDQYTVLSSTQVGITYVLTAISTIIAAASGLVTSSSGTFTGFADYQLLQDGENWIASTDLQSVAGLPQFTTRKAWQTVPASNEEIRLVAVTAAQLCRFWNQLIVTGLSNVTAIDNSEYGRQVQVTTNLLGATGSVQVAGGDANGKSIAIIGAGSESEDKVGVFQIPYDARTSLVAGGWVVINQTITQNKILGFNGNTSIQTFANGISIVGGVNGSFQSARVATQNSTTVVKAENHDGFQAFIGVAGMSMGLLSDPTAYVREGDWVRIRYVGFSNAWAIGNTYASGAHVDYSNGYSYVNIDATIGGSVAVAANAPDGINGNLFWRRLGFDFGNQGVFRVVRVFGQNAFWIENPNAIEELVQLSAGTEISFYSYDSIMPGDLLQISGNILGTANVGQYRVIDEAAGGVFPTASRIYTETIPVPQAPTSLGNEFSQVTISEASPIRLWKRIVTAGPGQSPYANVIVDTPNLMNKISSSLGASITLQGKLGYGIGINYGLDSYKYYQGLIEELNRVLYGDPTNPIDYPGVRAAGTDVDIKASIIKRLTVSVAVRIRTGVPFNEIRARVQSAIAGYVNSLGVGEQVSLSQIVVAASSIDGVISVVITYPTYDAGQDLIVVGADQKAFIVDPTSDITCSILGG